VSSSFVDRYEITVEDTAGRPGRSPSRVVWRERFNAARARVAPALPALRVVGFLAAVSIVVYMGVRAAGEVHPRDWTFWPLPIALLGAATWWLGLGRGWSLLVNGRTTRNDISVWCRTQALRFLPGGFWAPASRVLVVHGKPLDKMSTVAGENLLALTAAMTIGGVALAVAGRMLWLGLAVAILIPLVAARLLRERIRITPARSVRGAVNYLLAFAAYGIAAVLVQLAVSGLHDPAAVAGAASVAWAAGLVVVIAPSGVGVRELVYVKLLAGTLPHAELAAAAVTMRLIMIIAECAVLVIIGRPAATAPD
jgi:glycosyltransferase 2 family protein